MSAAGEVRPVPDPTTLTTEQLLREVATLRELIEVRLSAAKDMADERYNAVDKRFALIEHLRVEQKADTQAAVDAALTAQKEAVREQTIASERAIAKSEGTITKQLSQISTTFDAAIAAVEVLLQDTKDRVGRIESFKQGGRETVAAIYALGGFIAVLLTIGATLAATGGIGG